ncbi:MAG: hypothetical protein E4H11_00325 [Myxococcales bacterium]|nr:MAG: hypothetical protein E4H11_00325 [Myxococcales bacterium]
MSSSKRLRALRLPIFRRAGQRGPGGLSIRREAQARWQDSARGTRVTVQPERLVEPDTRIFTMGSCFAVEIRSALRERGRQVLPDYFRIQYPADRASIGKLPQRDNINHYDSHSIVQEFERAFGEASAASFPPLDVVPGSLGKRLGSAARWQDPYRREVYAVCRDSIESVSDAITQAIGEGIHGADVYVLTLGLIETWADAVSGRHVWSEKVRRLVSDPERIRFHQSSFEENLGNLRRVCDLLHHHYPNRPVVLTVSPVALGETFSGMDVVSANTLSKSLLRTVAGQIQREYPSVRYWPSYELAQRNDIFEPDGRHVKPSTVSHIVQTFLENYG